MHSAWRFNIVKFKKKMFSISRRRETAAKRTIPIINIFCWVTVIPIMPLYSVVSIKNWQTKFVVKTSWCKGMNSAKVKKFGCRRTTERTIFYSSNLKETPDFSLPIQRDFDLKQNGCYRGFVLKTFSEYFSNFFVFLNYFDIVWTVPFADTKSEANEYRWQLGLEERERRPNARGRPKITAAALKNELETKKEMLHYLEQSNRKMEKATKDLNVPEIDQEEYDELFSSDEDDTTIEPIHNSTHEGRIFIRCWLWCRMFMKRNPLKWN